MPLNQHLVGRQYQAPTYQVSRELIRRFAEAIGDTNPVSLDPAAARDLGYADVVAPPTFLTVLGFRFEQEGPIVDPELGLDYSVVVHGEQSFVLHQPVVAGDVLSSTTRITTIRNAGRNELLEMVTQVIGRDGEAVATLTNTLVSRGTAEPLKDG